MDDVYLENYSIASWAVLIEAHVLSVTLILAVIRYFWWGWFQKNKHPHPLVYIERNGVKRTTSVVILRCRCLSSSRAPRVKVPSAPRVETPGDEIQKKKEF